MDIRLSVRLSGLFSATLACACLEITGPDDGGSLPAASNGCSTIGCNAEPVARIAVNPSSVVTTPGQTFVLRASYFGSSGYPTVSQEAARWSISDDAVLSILAPGKDTVVVHAARGGTASVTASLTGAQASVTVTVERPVAAIEVHPHSGSIAFGDSLRLVAVALDSEGNVLEGRAVTWEAQNPETAILVGPGLVVGVGAGEGLILARTETVESAARIVVSDPPSPSTYRLVSAGDGHTCGISTDQTVHCWGSNASGQLGTPFPAQGVYEPAAVATTLELVDVEAAHSFTCGLDDSGSAYCWGYQGRGRLGDGESGHGIRWRPEPVSGGRKFEALSLGKAVSPHICGVSIGGAMYCWGEAAWTLGPEFPEPFTRPVRVHPSLVFESVAAGGRFTCGIVREGEVVCWGANDMGQLGSGDTIAHFAPQALAGDLRATQVTAGINHACALVADGAVYCWGAGARGELGDGWTRGSTTPVAVEASQRFTSISAGQHHTCGVTLSREIYCWGAGNVGQLGRGTTMDSPAPAPVTGGLSFSSVRAGGLHTCAVATDGTAYCWGWGRFGELGAGTASASSTPIRVAGQR